jgi:hypothetical protein
VQWGASDAMGGWDITPPTSPVGEVNAAWPDMLVDECSSVWPFPSEVVHAHCDAWPGFLLDAIEIEVTVEEYSNVEESNGSTPPVGSHDIGHCLVINLLSCLCHSPVSTSCSGCAPCCYSGRID